MLMEKRPSSCRISRSRPFDHLEGQLLAGQRGVGGHADQRAFQAADVGANAVGQEIHDFLRQRHAHDLRLLLQNGQAHLDVRRLQVGDQPPLEARDQPVFQVLNLAGRPVAGQHDLLVRLVQRVEGVEELLLNPLLAGQKLDVVNQQHVRLPVFLAESGELVVLDAVNVFVGELLGGDVGDARALLVADDMLADGVQQMRLAQADAAVKEKRIVGFAGRLRHRQRGGVGKIVVVADHERVEGVLGIEDAGRRCWATVREMVRRPWFWPAPGTGAVATGAVPVPILNLTCNWRPAATAMASCNRLM